MLTPQLSRQLAKHFQEQGRFSPFTYTIGLQSSFKESEEAMQPYPISEPITEATISQFSRSLTFFHEATHLCQFVSSAYGLRTLRYTLVCLRNLSRGNSWELPIATSLLNRKGLSADEQRTYEGALIFLDGLDQLRLHQHVFLPGATGDMGTITLDYLPWSPHFFVLSDQSYEGREEYAKYLKSIGAHVRKLVRLTMNASTQSYTIVLNVAALMESYAILVEMNHIKNALNLTFSESRELLPTGNEYYALVAYMLQEEICPGNILTPLSIIIDASLMYDPFILYNVPWDVPDKEGRHEQYPGETFITLCEAAKRTEPMRHASADETARFYKELCHNAGLPDPDWMAQKSYEVAQTLLNKAPWDQALLGRALKAHTDALKFRCDQGAAAFPFFLPTTNYLYKLVGLALPAISFYNLSTLQPEGFDPRKIDAATIHSILLQAISEPTIQCPLKMGEPFFCDSALLPPDSLCVWQFGDETRECLIDVLERQFGFRSS